MDDTSNARTSRQPTQLPLFDTGETLVEIAVPPNTPPNELRAIGAALVTLTRYAASKVPGPVRS